MNADPAAALAEALWRPLAKTGLWTGNVEQHARTEAESMAAAALAALEGWTLVQTAEIARLRAIEAEAVAAERARLAKQVRGLDLPLGDDLRLSLLRSEVLADVLAILEAKP